MTTAFQVGKTYNGRVVTDSEMSVSFTVASRTKSFVTTTDGKRLGINRELTAYNSAETVFPWGRYSMAPIVTAS